MGKTVHARIDERSRILLEKLRRRTGCTESELIRRGLAVLASQPTVGSPRRVVGLGKFASGKTDLGSNKAHLRGFGRR